jgi:hypothetical protein
MGFLKKLGQILLKGTQIITGIGPLFPNQAGIVGRVADTLERITDVIVSVELFGQTLGISGADKLRAAVPAATQIILKSDLLAGKRIDQPVLFTSGVTKIVDGLVEVLNSLKPEIKTEDVN